MLPVALSSPVVRALSTAHLLGAPQPAHRNYREIDACRICGNHELAPVVSLGEQYLTGVFPSEKSAELSCGPLELVACDRTHKPEACGLVQLRQTYNLDEMYGENYGYRSALNRSMVQHLKTKLEGLMERYPVAPGDLVLDIGSNDGTLLSFYPAEGVSVVGIDPSAKKFASYYRDHITLVPDFFSADVFRQQFGSRKARIITSIAMFYDLESPLSFVQDIASVLDDEGVWHFEMSYMPSMVRTMGYDTICHEHLEYYSLRQIKWMTDRCDLKILNVEFNAINGGSFAVTAARNSSSHPENTELVEALLEEEGAKGLATQWQQRAFESAVEARKEELVTLLRSLKAQNRTVLGLGASTKGNVLLQHCGITADLLPAIAEVNKDKFGCFTPGTNIPIIPEFAAHAMNPEYLLVLPWHFRDNLIERERAFLARGGKMIFPLPNLEVYSEE